MPNQQAVSTKPPNSIFILTLNSIAFIRSSNKTSYITFKSTHSFKCYIVKTRSFSKEVTSVQDSLSVFNRIYVSEKLFISFGKYCRLMVYLEELLMSSIPK